MRNAAVLLHIFFVLFLFGCITQQPSKSSEVSNDVSNFSSLSKPPVQADQNKTEQNNTQQSTNFTEAAVEPESKIPANFSFIARDEVVGIDYSGYEIVNESGIYITFEEPLKQCATIGGDMGADATCYSGGYATESHRVSIPILDKKYMISCLTFNKASNASKLCLMHEEGHKIMSPMSCEQSSNTEYISAGKRRFAFSNLDASGEVIMAILCELTENDTCKEQEFAVPCMGEMAVADGVFHAWECAPGYTFCSTRIDISYSSDKVVIEDNADGAKLNWEEQAIAKENKSSNFLKSIFIPSNSSAYRKLVGN